MALANADLQSHIKLDSSASLFRTDEEVLKEAHEEVDQRSPRLTQKYKARQIDSIFVPLPKELELLLLSACWKGGSYNARLSGVTCA